MAVNKLCPQTLVHGCGGYQREAVFVTPVNHPQVAELLAHRDGGLGRRQVEIRLGWPGAARQRQGQVLRGCHRHTFLLTLGDCAGGLGCTFADHLHLPEVLEAPF